MVSKPNFAIIHANQKKKLKIVKIKKIQDKTTDD